MHSKIPTSVSYIQHPTSIPENWNIEFSTDGINNSTIHIDNKSDSSSNEFKYNESNLVKNYISITDVRKYCPIIEINKSHLNVQDIRM